MLLGCGPDELPGSLEAFGERIHPDDSEGFPHRSARGQPGAVAPFSVDLRLAAGEGAWRWVQVEGVRRFNDIGRLDAVDAVILDAQERRDAEEEMARNEERFLRLSGGGRAGFFEIDLEGDRAWFSAGFLRALGWRPDEVGASTDGFMDLLAPGEAEAGAEAFFTSLLREATGMTCRYALRHKDGRSIPVEAYLAGARDRSGRLVRVWGLQTVGAEPDRAVARAPGDEEDRRVVRQALDAVAESVLVLDAAGLVQFANARAAQDAGQAAEALCGRPFDEAFPLVERATGGPATGIVGRMLGRGQPLELDRSFSLARGDGPKEVLLTCRPVLDARQRPAGAIVVLRRPSEMPLSPAELLASNRMEALGRLASGIAHDFNNLLTTVDGGVSIALEKRDLAPLETAQKACDAARNLARQLLTFARGDTAGKRVCSLNDCLRDTARMTRAGSKSTVELELAGDLHPVRLDPAQFVQVFTNLILNAMQVMPQGGRIVARTLNMPLGPVNSVSLPAGDYVRVEVQDNGPGIPPENLDRIFEPFFTTRADGTGLGLPTVRSIVAQHEGAIEASSTVGSGTTFTIYLPRAYNEVVKEPPRPMAVTYGSGRVLVMDDDQDICMISKGMLDLLGYEADTVSDGAEAISKFRKQMELGRPYAAVILDLTMAGGLGGAEVLARLRELAPGVKAIVSSGYATAENAEEYLRMGFVGILSKPYRSADMGRVLKEVIG